MKPKLLCWKLRFLWCILNAYKIDAVMYFFNMICQFSLICSIVCVCVKYQIKLIGLCVIIALDIGGLFSRHCMYPIVQQSSSMLMFLCLQFAEEVSYSY